MDEKPVRQEVDNAPSDSTHHTTEAVTGYYFKAPAPEVEIYHDPVARDAIGGQLDTMPPGYYTSVPFIGTVVACCLANISGYLSWVVPANTLVLIGMSLDPTGKELPNLIWVALAYTTGFTVGMALLGRLSDIFGRRWLFILCSVLPLIGNIIGASAQNINTLIGVNTINGLGGAGQLSFSVVIGELVPNKQRGPWNALVLGTSIPFSVFGPPIARNLYLHSALQWRWCYIMGAIINVLAVAGFFFCYHPPNYNQLHVGGKTMMKQIKGLDWVGIFLFVAGQVLFLVGLNWGGQVYPWSSAKVLCMLIMGIATIAGFCLWEAFSGHLYPLIPMSLFKNVKYVAIVICAGVAAMIYYPMSVLWPTLIGSLFTTDIVKTGWLSCAVGGGINLGEMLGGMGVRYIPRMKIQMTVAACLMTGCAAALATSNASSEKRSAALLTVAATAAGYIEALCLSSMALVWEPEDIGLVAGVLGSLRTAFGAVGASIYSSVLANELKKKLPQYVVPAAVGAGLPASSVPSLFAGITAGSFADVPGITPTIAGLVASAVKFAYSKSFFVVFLATLPFGFLAIGAALLSPNIEDYLTDDVARRLQDGEKGHAVDDKAS